MSVVVIRITSTADNGWYEVVKSLYATDSVCKLVRFSLNSTIANECVRLAVSVYCRSQSNK